MKIFTSFMNNKKRIIALSNKIATFAFSVGSCFALLYPTDEVLNCIINPVWRITLAIISLIGLYLLFVIISAFIILNKKKERIITFRSRHSLYIEYGDLFSCGQKNEKKNIVFAGNRCFDTIVDEDLINSNSIHGIALNRIYSNTNRTPANVSKEIQKNLHKHNYSYENVDRKDKRSGNLQRYEVSSIAEINGINNERYFILGLSLFDSELRAQVEKEEYIKAIGALIKYITDRAQGYTTYMPVVGAGCADVGTINDLLMIIVSAIKLLGDNINCDIHIVVDKKDEKLDLYKFASL